MFKKLLQSASHIVSPGKNVHVVIVGHQKSGTSAIAGLLSHLSGLALSNDPLYAIDNGSAETVELLLKNPGRFKQVCRMHPVLFGSPVIKDPDFTFIFPQVQACYRHAHFLFVIRDPRDTIRSICNRLGLKGADSRHKIEHLKITNCNRHWERIISGSLPSIPGSGDSSQDNFFYNLAHRWNHATNEYQKNKESMVLIKYEDFLLNKEKCINDIAGKLNLPKVNSITEFLDVQFQPKGNPHVDLEEFFGSDNLLVIEKICERYMEKFGYDSLLSS